MFIKFPLSKILHIKRYKKKKGKKKILRIEKKTFFFGLNKKNQSSFKI